MGVLGAMFGGTYLSMSGGSKKAQPATPPINASSPGEEDFIKCVVYREPVPTAPIHNTNKRIGSSWRRRTRVIRRRLPSSNGLDCLVHFRDLATDIR